MCAVIALAIDCMLLLACEGTAGDDALPWELSPHVRDASPMDELASRPPRAGESTSPDEISRDRATDAGGVEAGPNANPSHDEASARLSEDASNSTAPDAAQTSDSKASDVMQAPHADRAPAGSILQWGTGDEDWGNAIAVDSHGNAYVTGTTFGSLDGPEFGQSDFFLTKIAPDFTIAWTRQFGSPATEGGRSIAVDQSGNVFASGTTYGDFEGRSNPAPGTGDAFLIKVASDGQKQWVSGWGSEQDEYVYGTAVDTLGHVYVVGRADDDLFVVQHDASSGAALWKHVWGTKGYDEATCVCTDGHGNAYVAGMTSGKLDGIPNAGDSDIFVTRFAPSGTQLLTRLFGTKAYDAALGIACDNGTEQLVITGTTRGIMDNVNAGNGDTFVMKLTMSLEPLWTRQVGTTEYEEGKSVAVDALGQIWFTGQTEGNFDPTRGPRTGIFAGSFDPSGALLWLGQYGVSTDDLGSGIAVGVGKAYVVGTTAGVFGSASAGLNDAFLLRLR